ncbi:MAG: sodium:calcium antiporter [Gammaproteobacteria bacterium]
MSNAVLAWIEFLISALLIAAAGARLARYGDVIAEKTGLSGSWIGLIMLSTVTSLPELFTGISAVALADAPDIALGNLLGASVFVLLMIVVLDFLQRGESLYTRLSQGHILSAAFAVVMLGLVAVNLVLAPAGLSPAFSHIGTYTPALALIYVVALRAVFRYERRAADAYVHAAAERYPRMTLRQALVRYALAAVVVVGAALWLPFAAVHVAQAMEWQDAFVGTVFVALATTLPELAVTLGALRVGALDMAIGNLFGSILFNMLLIAVNDVIYLKGPLLAHVSGLHAVSALSAMIMTGVAIIGLIYRPRTRLMKTISWVSLSLLAVYILNVYILYLYGT